MISAQVALTNSLLYSLRPILLEFVKIEKTPISVHSKGFPEGCESYDYISRVR